MIPLNRFNGTKYMTSFRKVTINSESLKLEGVLCEPTKSKGVGILFLHGGGNSNAERYHDVQAFFADHGVTSLAFSFRGCGKSEGELYQSNLQDRLVDAESALTTFKSLIDLSDDKIFLWGSSMGGHIACKLISKHISIRGIILQSAAAYGKIAESVNFGSQFTQIIQQENIWKESQAFSCLSTYSGPSLILYGADDTVIPEDVKDSFQRCSTHSTLHKIEGYGHTMLRPTSEVEKLAWNQMVNLGLNFIVENQI